MAKNKSKKSSGKGKKNGASMQAHTDTFEHEAEELEAAGKGPGDEDEEEGEELTPMDENEVRRLWPEVIAEEKRLADAENAVKAQKAVVSERVQELRKALGSGGPHLINGQRFHIRTRGEQTFLARENPRAMQDMVIPVE
jgi:hypothetical protein